MEICFTWNLHGHTEFAWTHGICMDTQNLHGRMEFAWTHRIFIDSALKLDKVVELVSGGSAINGAYPIKAMFDSGFAQ